MTRWKSTLLTFLTSILVVGCTSKINQENFDKIKAGMGYDEVIKILGEPTETGKVGLAGLTATTATWESKDGKVVIQFFNNEVKLKNFSGKGVETIEIE